MPSRSFVEPIGAEYQSPVSGNNRLLGIWEFAASTEGFSISGNRCRRAAEKRMCPQMCSSTLCTDLFGQFKGVLSVDRANLRSLPVRDPIEIRSSSAGTRAWKNLSVLSDIRGCKAQPLG
jgi:hypothetical protein